MKQLLCLNCSRLNALGSARCANEDCRMALTPRTSRLVDDQPQPPSGAPLGASQLSLCPNCNGLTLAPDAPRCPECRWPTRFALPPSAGPRLGAAGGQSKAKRSSKSAQKPNGGGAA